ncbi:RHS repeat-associated core domain-containing protein, partial [Ralstonia solanacearum species complex bacterium KE055]
TNSYDAAGNQTGDGTTTYSYSDRGRLASVTKNGTTTSYLYNGLEQRVVKSGTNVPTGATRYVYDEAGHLIGEYDQSGNAIQETVYLGDTPIATLKNGTPYYIYADQIDTPRVITDTNNLMVWRWDQTDPFGATLPDENPTSLGAFTYNLRFPGQVYDAETGKHYNANRDYDPAGGRYVQSDPIGLDGGQFSTYAYVGGNPISSVDPFGLASCTFTMSTGRLICMPTDSQNSSVNIPVASGNNGGGQQCRNNPACTAIANHGPIPTGCWRWTNGTTSKPNGRVLEPCPGTNTNVTENRTLIRSHSCANPFGPGLGPQYCSKGCVTGTVHDMQNLNGLIDAEPGSTLQVVP